jgi:hypothetical protein
MRPHRLHDNIYIEVLLAFGEQPPESAGQNHLFHIFYRCYHLFEPTVMNRLCAFSEWVNLIVDSILEKPEETLDSIAIENV